jgi:3-methyladenine DNA glycosylase AlkD
MNDVLQTLRSLGKESTVKTYRRHGAVGEVLGVSYADLGKLQKKHRDDHSLAQQLWKTGIHDARVLATQIADVSRATRKELEAWVAEVEGYPLTDALATFVAKTPLADACRTAWMKSKNEWVASAGWRLLTAAAHREDDTAAAHYAPYLQVIEQRIHHAQNRVRAAMNTALIAIGARGGALEAQALKVAKAIGPVEVDHGDTDCQTPDAAAYIAKIKARRAQKKTKR